TWAKFFEQLVVQNRATTTRLDEHSFWVLAEKLSVFKAIFPTASFSPQPAPVVGEAPWRSEAIFQTIQGWMRHSGPTTAAELSMRLQIPTNEIELALLRLESTGAILRGSFTSSAVQQSHT